MPNRANRILFFFPFQLLWVQLKKNHMMLFFWLMLFGFVTKNIGLKYGIPYLFLYPEYLEHVGFTSHLILGLGVGGFIMAFNIASYINNGFLFTFIATLARPFIKFSINNFIIPIAFIITHIIALIDFQINNEYEPISQILLNIAGRIVGISGFLFVSLTYFFSTNKNLSKLFGIEIETPKRSSKERKENPVKEVLHKKEKWFKIFSANRNKEWRVDTYLSQIFRISLARRSQHYDKQMLEKVFAQNHINASYFELMVVLSMIGLGFLKEYQFMMIPAGATVLLSFTMFLMLSSALHSWLKGWSTTVFIALFIIINHLSQYATFNYTNYAYGLNYTGTKAEYSNRNLKLLQSDVKNRKADFDATIETLNKWRLKNTMNSIERHEKPKLVLLNVSGGGIRSALWTYHALQYADSITKGELFNHAFLITGSSGGMVGAAYFREIYLSDKTNINSREIANNIGKDILNSMTYSMAVNDMFLRLQTFNVGENSYTKDRGYAFEKQLNINTKWVLDKKLRDYQAPVANAKIPMMVFAPTITNDGRKLLISSTNISYLVDNTPLKNIRANTIPESVEFNKLFEKQGARELMFTSALRMNATFPYVMPNASLPSEPSIEVMDAGLRDNFGLSISVKFMSAFKNWISSNTSGVVIVEIRDKFKEFKIPDNPLNTITQNLSSQVGTIYNTWDRVQMFNQDDLLQYTSFWFDGQVDVVSFQLMKAADNDISLSWHLTNKEKRDIYNAIDIPDNQEAINRLNALLN